MVVRVRLRVDPIKCKAHGMCGELFPELLKKAKGPRQDRVAPHDPQIEPVPVSEFTLVVRAAQR